MHTYLTSYKYPCLVLVLVYINTLLYTLHIHTPTRPIYWKNFWIFLVQWYIWRHCSRVPVAYLFGSGTDKIGTTGKPLHLDLLIYWLYLVPVDNEWVKTREWSWCCTPLTYFNPLVHAVSVVSVASPTLKGAVLYYSVRTTEYSIDLHKRTLS